MSMKIDLYNSEQMVTVKHNSQCPSFDWVCADADSCSHCIFCQSISDDETVCSYSKEPTYDSPFKKGDFVYRVTELGISFARAEKVKVRTSHWEGDHWEYMVGREQHVCKVYATEHEASVAACQKRTKELFSGLESLKEYMQKSGVKLHEIAPPELLGQLKMLK